MWHFIKDANSRMDVPLAMHILSASVAIMMRKAVEDVNVAIGSIRNKNIVMPLIIFIEKWNRMVDIMLGHAYGAYTPENGRRIQLDLLSFLRWMTKWNNDHKERMAKGERTEWNFFADATWNCIQMLILSHVVIIEFYCRKMGFKIKPSAITTDPCEKHFGNCRQNQGGSRTSLNSSQWTTGDCKATLAESANFAAVGNNRNANKNYETKDICMGRSKRFP